MYCVNCGSPVTSSLSYCNRCGSNLRDKAESNKTGPISAYLTAITLIGITGLGIMLGGAIVLRTGVGMPVDFIAFFLLQVFLVVLLTEVMLIRSLSRVTSANESRRQFTPAQQPPLELHSPASSTFTKPVSSVTDNTTRTLEYARRDT
jgi:hypothetical protein